MIGTLGAIWAHGGAVDWGGFDAGEVRRRIPAPLYPFQRKPYFVAPPQPHDVSSTEEFAEGDRIEDLARWVHQRVWQPLPPPLPRPGALEDGVLVLVDGGAAGQDLVARLEAAGTSPVVVRVGPAFEVGTDGVAVRPDHHDDWVRLWSWLATDEGGGLPGTVVHAWCLTASGDADASPASREARAFWAPVHMVRALEELHPGHELQWVTIASGSLAASPGEGSPEHALLQGPTRVVPREIPTISTRLIDPGVLPEQPAARRAIVSRLVDELRGSDPRVRIGYRGLERLEPSFIPVPLDDPGPIDGLADHATVLITGGLGGIALSLARSMAERRPLRFVLLGRAGLPPRDQWSDWAARHPDDVKTGRAIREVRAIEALGSTVDVRAADVTDTAAMTRLVSDVREASGGLDAVVHAAGVLDDGPLLGREADRMRAVLGAKVAGARALDAAVGDTPLEFFVVFSSVSAVLGAAGQTDYAAANAFLGAFARERERRTGQRTVSVGWGAWRDVGMAAELAGRASYGGGDDEADRGDPLDHPFFERRIRDRDGRSAFRGRMAWGRHWMLDEHRTRDGKRLLPGSGYVELISEAARMAGIGDPVIHNLTFLRPFRVDEDETREIELSLAPNGLEWRVEVRGRPEGAAEWIEHAVARLGPEEEPSRPEPLDAVVARIGPSQDAARPRHPVMDFGPRWANVVSARLGAREALLEQALPTSFLDDLESSRLHPALLDMATAGAPDLVPGIDPTQDFLIPTGYGQVRVHDRLGPALQSHIRLREADAEGLLASFDITLYDPDGRVLAEVDDFTMMR
ncbi:MAG: SDR family NAD(P)-dependent oxidoreductase, partial [Gemmatimonadetes bacterium]|nr:SDR family NAD(P)-dependent oxidoreductase [Gemmatimonadota bacterium]